MAIYLEDMLPGVKYNGLATTKAIDFSGAASMSLPSGTTSTSASLTTPTMTSPVVSSGSITFSAATGGGIAFTGTGANGGLLTNLIYAVATATSLSTLDKSIRVSLGGANYYIPAYATAA